MTTHTHLEMGAGTEFDLIRGLLAAWGARATGIGDDAAVLDVPAGERLVASTDATVEHVHFRRAWMSAAEIGGRATAAALSDIAAMAARPIGLLLALGVPDDWRGELDALAHGIGEVATACACPIVGGNVSVATELSLTLTVLGSAATPLSRAGARAGDVIFVTGRLGGPGAALRALLAGGVPAVGHRARFVAPMPRLREARWLADRGARAAIDISDGLVADAAHLARASGVSLAIDAQTVPIVAGVSLEGALASGEEYELLVAMSPDAELHPTEFEHAFGLPLTAIGRVTAAGTAAVLLDGADASLVRGHDHLHRV